MPKQVDHDEQRLFVADIAADLIAFGGLEAVRIRDVAKAAGVSTAIVSHYFTNKRELLLFTYRATERRVRNRLTDVVRSDPADLRGTLEALMPLDLTRLRDWRVWLAFQGRAISDPLLGLEQRKMVRAAEGFIANVISAGNTEGPDPNAAALREASRLVVFVTGVATQTIFDAEVWSPKRQLDFLDDELNSISSTAAPRPIVRAGVASQDV